MVAQSLLASRAGSAPLVRLIDKKWVLCDEGAALLRGLTDQPIVVVAVAGMYVLATRHTRATVG